MSSPVFTAPLRLECRPSYYLTLAVVIAHGVALLVLFPITAAWWIKFPVAVVIAAQWVIIWRRDVKLSSPAAVKSLICTTDGRWELCRGDGGCYAATLLPAAYISPWLVLLRFMTEDKRRCAVILPADGLDADSHRRLRVQLRLQNGAKQAQD